MTTLERLISESDKPRLRKAAENRYSCHGYAEPLSVSDWAALSYTVGRYGLPGARLILQRVPEALFSGTLLSINRVSGCTAVAVVTAERGIRASRIHAGALGELLCLEAVDLGFASCWITGSYRSGLLCAPVSPREETLGVIALGHPAVASGKPGKRKPLEHLCSAPSDLWPPMCRRAAELIRMAPSAMNLQPWMISCENGCFTVDTRDRSGIELGIALCHAELAFTGPHQWQLGRDSREPAAYLYLNGFSDRP